MSDPRYPRRRRSRLSAFTPWPAALLLAAALPWLQFRASLWSDEASSVWFARLPAAHLLQQLCDPHPPGYYLLLKAWMQAGESEPWLRTLSLLASLLAITLTYRLGRDLGGAAAGTAAALLLALHPLQSWYAAEVRMYTAVQALGIAVVWIGWRLLAQASAWRWRWVLAYVAALLAACWVDFTALLPWGCLQLLWVSRGAPRPRRWLTLQVVALLPFVAWWLTSPQRLAVADGYQAVFVAVQAQALGLDWTPMLAARVLSLGALLAAGLGFMLAWGWSRGLRARAGNPLRLVLWFLIWILILALAASPRLYTFKRLLVVLLPYLAVGGGLFLSRVVRFRQAVFLYPILAIGLLLSFYAMTAHTREPWREAVAGVRAQVVWVDELAAPAVAYYVRQQGRTDLAWTPLAGRRLPDLPDLVPPPGAPLQLMLLESPYRNLYPLLPASFHAGYVPLEAQHEHGLAMYHFQRRLQPLADPPSLPSPSLAVQWGLLLASPLDTCEGGL